MMDSILERLIKLEDKVEGYNFLARLNSNRIKDIEDKLENHKKAVNKHIDKKHSQLRNALKKILSKHFNETNERVSRLEYSHIDLKNLEVMIQQHAIGLQNVYDEFMKIKGIMELKNHSDLTSHLSSLINDLSSKKYEIDVVMNDIESKKARIVNSVIDEIVDRLG